MNCRENFEANRSIIHVDIDIVRGHTFSIESRLYMYTGMGFRMNKRQDSGAGVWGNYLS